MALVRAAVILPLSPCTFPLSRFNTIIKQRCDERYAGLSIRPDSYWVKGALPLKNRLFPVALSKDGGGGRLCLPAALDALPQYGCLCFPPLSFPLIALLSCSVAMAAAMAASRRFRVLPLWRESLLTSGGPIAVMLS